MSTSMGIIKDGREYYGMELEQKGTMWTKDKQESNFLTKKIMSREIIKKN